VQEALKPVPALFLPNRRDFPETVDGLVLGIASGLGFSVAESIVAFSSVITSLPAHTVSGNWIYDLATIAVLQPLLQGSATGIVVAAVWRYRRGRLSSRELGGIGVAVIAHIAFSFGTQLWKDALLSPLFVLVWQAAVVGTVLVYVRFLLHHSLLEEAAHMGYAETLCPNCHMHIVASGFCPNCGMALTAAPAAVKRARKPRAEGAAKG
jgi:RsiW-degrading membrane proteinase PrsW (M82 family)